MDKLDGTNEFYEFLDQKTDGLTIMNKTLTIDQLQELLQIQKEFDDRILTLNLGDSKIAYVVEFFEWFNTLETFKNWKKKPGKLLDVLVR